tara:strand:- start:205 stop:537 length:333 start_codon:yes stop_codon:yes gene_type:complete
VFGVGLFIGVVLERGDVDMLMLSVVGIRGRVMKPVLTAMIEPSTEADVAHGVVCSKLFTITSLPPSNPMTSSTLPSPSRSVARRQLEFAIPPVSSLENVNGILTYGERDI